MPSGPSFDWKDGVYLDSTLTVYCERLTPTPDSVRIVTVTAFLMRSRMTVYSGVGICSGGSGGKSLGRNDGTGSGCLRRPV